MNGDHFGTLPIQPIDGVLSLLSAAGHPVDPIEAELAVAGPSTSRAVRNFQQRQGLVATGVLDDATRSALAAAQPDAALPTLLSTEVLAALSTRPTPTATAVAPTAAAPAGGFDVHGFVTSNGFGVPAIQVVVVDLDVRGVEVLSTDSPPTNVFGGYVVNYPQGAGAAAEAGTADLAFVLFTTTGSAAQLVPFLALDAKNQPLPTILFQPPGSTAPAAPVQVLFNAGASETVNFVVPAPFVTMPSEFDLLVAQLGPPLANLAAQNPAGTIEALAELRPEEIDFLAFETGVDRSRIAGLAAAAVLSKAFFNDPAPPAFYAFARVRGLIDMAGLAATSVTDLRGALITAGGVAGAPGENIVPPFPNAAEVDRIVDRVHTLSAQTMLTLPPQPGRAPLSQVFATALPAAGEQQQLVNTYANAAVPAPQFWAALRLDPSFQEHGKVERAQFALGVAALADNRPALVDLLQASASFTSLRDLALNTDALPGLVAQVPPDQLDDVPGANLAEKVANYANQLTARLQLAHPTETCAALIQGLAASTAPPASAAEPDPVSTFLMGASSPQIVGTTATFDIRTTHVDRFVRQFDAQLFLPRTTPQQKAAIVAGVKRAQRLFHVSASPGAFQALYAAGLSSARQIAGIPRAVFVDRYAERLGGPEAAAFTHGKATSVGLLGAHLAVQLHQAANDAGPLAAGGGIKVLPDWAQMFGGVELCECADCQSVLGPAAYFVDLLEFLDLRHARPNRFNRYPIDYLLGSDAGDGLAGRRPDLAYLQLSCENTNTPLPYVDLVNEILESYVVLGFASKDAAHDVAGATPAELLANPQYVSEAAYATLRDKVYPPSLPFDRSLEAERLYLAQLTTSRLDLIRAFVAPGSDRWTPAAVAERLGLSAREYEIVAGATLAGAPAPQDVKQLYGFAGLPDPAGVLIQNESVRRLLEQLGVSYLDLIAILTSRLVNPAQAQLRLIEALALSPDEVAQLRASNFTNVPPSVQARLDAMGRTVIDLQQWFAAIDGLAVLVSKGADCDLDTTFLERGDAAPVGDDVLLTLHRFLRLWRKLQWSTDDLDRVLLALGYAADPVAALRALAQLLDVAPAGDAPLPAWLVLWSTLDAHGDASLYRQIFRNRALASSPDPDFDLTPEEDELAIARSATPVKLLDKLGSSSLLQAALRATTADLTLIAADAGLDASALLNLANLSLLYRWALLGRQLGAPLRLLIELRNLAAASADPFASPLTTLAFVALVHTIQAASLNQRQLGYVCRHDDPDGLTGQANGQQARALGAQLLAGLGSFADLRTQLVGTLANPASPSAEQLATQAAHLPLVASELAIVIAVVEGSSPLGDAEKAAALRTDCPFLADALAAQLIPNITVDPNDPNGPALAEEQRIARRILFLGPLLDFQQRGFIRDTVSDALALPSDVRTLLLEDATVVHANSVATDPALADFLAPAAVPAPDFVASFTRLRKVAWLIATFGLSKDELNHLVGHPADFGGLDLNALPVVAGDGRPVFTMLLAIARFAALRDAASGPVALIDCFRAPDAATRQAAIAARTGLRVERVADAVGQLGIADAVVATTDGMALVFALLSLCAATGATPGRLKAWTGEPGTQLAAAIRDTLKGRFDHDAWLDVARPTSDALRARQRDSLIACVLTMPSIVAAGISNANQLFEYFLIDVQMDPCMLTSRIKQAISSVQLFIDRCLLNLEPAVPPSCIDAAQWSWRKSFVIEQANRKLFLYPENYVEPEVRDDKTPFFKELESELQQGDVSAAAAETAFGHYLAKLDEVARLETCGAFLEWPTHGYEGSRLHVIARTRDIPVKFFYRRFVDGREWTAWEPVDVEIQNNDDTSGANSGVQLLPVVWKGRLYLFWPTFTKRNDPPPPKTINPGDPVDLKPTAEYWEIKLAWSLYENGQWGQKRLSSGAFDFPPATRLLDGRVVHDQTLQGAKAPSEFKLRAFPRAGLEILLLTSIGAPGMQQLRAIGEFVIDNRNGGFVAFQTFRQDQNEVRIKGGVRSFTALQTGTDLLLELPGLSSVAMLGTAMPYRILTLEQENPVAIDAPYFVETSDAKYFCTARRDTQLVPIYLGRAERTVPAWLMSVSLFTAAGAASSTLSTSTVAQIAHPWVASSLSAQLASTATASGSVLAAAIGSAPRNQSILYIQEDVVYLRFLTAFHPWSGEFMRRLNAAGLDGLLSLDTQALGNPYLREPWRPGLAMPAGAGGSAASLVERGFEPIPGTGLNRANLDCVVLQGGNLVHYFHAGASAATEWTQGATITTAATGPGCMVARQGAAPNAAGPFEVIVPQGAQLLHFSQTGADAWSVNPAGPVTTQALGAGTLIETDYLSAGARSLEVLVLEPGPNPQRNVLAHYRRDNPSGQWLRLETLPDAFEPIGLAGFIQSRFITNGHGALEAVILERNPSDPQDSRQLVHYWKSDGQTIWNRGVVITEHAADAGFIVESRMRDAATHWPGNFELVVPEGKVGQPPYQLVHYWRDNSIFPELPWNRGQVITTQASGPASLVHGHFVVIGNFELLVPEPGGIRHYWHMNEGLPGTTGERFSFAQQHAPTNFVDSPYPRHEVDFATGGAYSVYNWELFFHIPLLIALRLHRNQRYAEARTWLHRIFNPSIDSQEQTAARFWQVLPLRSSENENIQAFLTALSSDTADAATKGVLQGIVDAWENNPFQPHRIARVRTVAYKKHVVMKYLDVLIAWGDHQFALDTIEAINEATQYYVMAANILGPRPEVVPERGKPAYKTFAELRAQGLDDFANAIEDAENEFPFLSAKLVPSPDDPKLAALLGTVSSLYFCVPKNDRLLSYWDQVEDRLYKIRHCMNLQGVVRQLPLFEPPIDPALLVGALAQGATLADAVSDLNAPLPYYRFSYVLDKALQLCADLRGLAERLLAALEKGDAGVLERMRAGHETALLTLVHEVRKQQVAEAEASIGGLRMSREPAVARWTHYRELLGEDAVVPDAPTLPGQFVAVPDTKASGKFALVSGGAMKTPGLDLGPVGIGGVTIESFDTGTKMLDYEQHALEDSFTSTVFTAAAAASNALAALIHLFPQIGLDLMALGIGGDAKFGGQQLGPAASALASTLQTVATIYSQISSREATLGSMVLRERDWVAQANQAAREIDTIHKQLLAARIRHDIAKQEQYNHEQQMAQAAELEAFLKSKVTNTELFSWMQGELGSLWSLACELARQAAKKAEQCYRFERGTPDTRFIVPSPYVGLKQNLMEAERLYVSLKQMERAYQDQNLREYELTRHISIATLDPLQLIRLKETGSCIIDIPETFFDLDTPGHYFRRIKSVALTIPCVVGPYETVNCSLRLFRHVLRMQGAPGAKYEQQGDDDPRFLVNQSSTQAIATSTAQRDAGLFEVNFRDERYLPFEGAGAISRWQLTLNTPFRKFDYDTITDVILHVQYTARDGGERLKGPAIRAVRDFIKTASDAGKGPLYRLLSLRHEFPSQWAALLSPSGSSEPDPVTRTVTVVLSKDRFAFYLAPTVIQPQALTGVAVPGLGASLQPFTLTAVAAAGTAGETAFDLNFVDGNGTFGAALLSSTPPDISLPEVDVDPAKAAWTLSITMSKGQYEDLRNGLGDVFLALSFTASM